MCENEVERERGDEKEMGKIFGRLGSGDWSRSLMSYEREREAD